MCSSVSDTDYLHSNYLSQLSDEILFKIWDYLSEDELLRLRRVSQRFKFISEWKLAKRNNTLIIDYSYPDDQIHALLNVYYRVKGICFRCSSHVAENMLKEFRNKLVNVEGIEICGYHTEGIVEAVTAYPHLKCLTLNGYFANDSEVSAFLSNLPELDYFEVINAKLNGECFSFAGDEINTIFWKQTENFEYKKNSFASKGHNLTKFNFDGCLTETSDHLMSDVTSYMINLKKLCLRFSHFFNLNESEYSKDFPIDTSSLNSLTKLESVAICCSRIIDNGSCSEKLTSVKKLSVELSFTDSNFFNFLSKFINVEKLELCYPHFSSNVGNVISAISRWKSLKWVNIRQETVSELCFCEMSDMKSLLLIISSIISATKIVVSLCLAENSEGDKKWLVNELTAIVQSRENLRIDLCDHGSLYKRIRKQSNQQ